MVGSPKATVENANREEASPITSTNRDMRHACRRELARWQGERTDFGQLLRNWEHYSVRRAALVLDSAVLRIFSGNENNFGPPEAQRRQDFSPLDRNYTAPGDTLRLVISADYADFADFGIRLGRGSSE